MTRGIGSPQTYFYRRVFVDAVRAVDAARSHPAIDADQGRRRGREPRWWHHAGRRRVVRRPRAGDARRAVSVQHAACGVGDRFEPLRRTGALPAHPSRPGRAGLRRAVVLRRRVDGGTSNGFRTLLCRVARRDLPAIDCVRRVQRLRRPQADRGVRLQRARRRRGRSISAPSSLSPAMPSANPKLATDAERRWSQFGCLRRSRAIVFHGKVADGRRGTGSIRIP